LQEAIDTLVDDQFSFEARELRVTFFAGEDVWALKFGSPGAFERFLQKYNKAAFENRFGQEQTDASEAKVGLGRAWQLGRAGVWLLWRGAGCGGKAVEMSGGEDACARQAKPFCTPQQAAQEPLGPTLDCSSVRGRAGVGMRCYAQPDRQHGYAQPGNATQ